MGIEPTTSGLDLPLLCRLSYEVAQRKSGTMTGRNSLHYCYGVSYRCWFAPEEAKTNRWFNSSNAVVCWHLILAYTVRLAIINVVELERNSRFFFLTLIEECCVVIERNIDKKLANRIIYQIWYKGCLKGKFGRGSKSAKGGPYPLADLNRGSKSAGGPNPWGVQIRGGPNPL